jgi:hypothetical protein
MIALIAEWLVTATVKIPGTNPPTIAAMSVTSSKTKILMTGYFSLITDHCSLE